MKCRQDPGKDKKMKKTKQWLVAGMIAVCFLSGCQKTGETNVLAPLEVSEENDGADGQDRVQTDGTENRNPALEQDDFSQRPAGQIMAPKKYQTTLNEEGMKLVADAPIEVPSLEKISIYETKASAYTEEDFENLRNYFAKENQIQWNKGSDQMLPPDSPQCRYLSYLGQGEDGPYYASMESWEGYETVLGSSNFMSAASKRGYEVFNRKEVTGTEQVKDGKIENLQKEYEAVLSGLKERAEMVLKDLGYEDFTLQMSRRMAVTAGEGESQSYESGMEGKSWAAFFAFSREVDGLPVTYAWSGAGNKKDDGANWRQEYVTMYLSPNGDIWRIDLQNRIKTGDILLEETFLLPFSEVQKIFESVLCTSFRDYGMVYNKKGEANYQYSFTVDSVKLGYLDTHEPSEGGFHEAGRLVPVWDFFGTVKVSVLDGSGNEAASQIFTQPELTLLTVNAVDGTVMERGD